MGGETLRKSKRQRTSDLLGTSMQDETDLLPVRGTEEDEEEEEERDEGQMETSLCKRSGWSTTPGRSAAPPN